MTEMPALMMFNINVLFSHNAALILLFDFECFRGAEADISQW